MLDHVAGVTYETVTIPEGADWRERVTAIAEANWASCQAHPWITDLATGRPVPGPGASTKYETELRALDGIGLTDIEMEHTLTALLSRSEERRVGKECSSGRKPYKKRKQRSHNQT